jgi:hypothetical protein
MPFLLFLPLTHRESKFFATFYITTQYISVLFKKRDESILET